MISLEVGVVRGVSPGEGRGAAALREWSYVWRDFVERERVLFGREELSAQLFRVGVRLPEGRRQGSPLEGFAVEMGIRIQVEQLVQHFLIVVLHLEDALGRSSTRVHLLLQTLH